MKKKHLLFLLFFINFACKVFPQDYQPLLSNSSWIVEVYDIGFHGTFTINPAVDQVIGAHTYKKFIDPFSNSTIFIREDVASKKVYKIINNQEELLFDFSLQVSNSITLSNGQNYIVSSITNVNVNGGQRRVFYLTRQSPSPGYNEIWIEGVGNAAHPLLARYEYFSDPVFYLKCSFQEGANIYNRGLANNGSPTDCEILGTETFVRQKIDFSPNPFQSELMIASEHYLQNATAKIYNVFGQAVKEIRNINGQKVILKRENLNTGIYFINLIENGELLVVKKIIISD